MLFQWLERINRNERSVVVSPTGEIVSIERPTQAELDRDLLVFIISIWHEAQHIATDIFLNQDHDTKCELAASGASGITSPNPNPGSQSSHQKRSTPPHIGTCKFEGEYIGDSGFALEEIIFGGRIGHVERGITPFEVMNSTIQHPH